MRVLVLNGSPKGDKSNTYRLTSAFLDGLRQTQPVEAETIEVGKLHLLPCRGCFGAAPEVRDQGAKMLSALAGLVAGKTPAEIGAAIGTIADPAGTFYRYGLPGSILRGRHG